MLTDHLKIERISSLIIKSLIVVFMPWGIFFSFLCFGGCRSLPQKNSESKLELPEPSKNGVLLVGPDSLLAVKAIVDFSLDGASEDSVDIKEGAKPQKISITIKSEATVGQVNQLLESIHARIVWSAKNSPNVEIRVMESKDPEYLQKTLDFLKAQKNVISFAVVVEE